MPVRLNKKSETIPAYQMKDGQIGAIADGHLAGRIVQRYDDKLIAIGEDSGQAYPNAISSKSEEFKVRLLEEGETICVTNN